MVTQFEEGLEQLKTDLIKTLNDSIKEWNSTCCALKTRKYCPKYHESV